MCGYTATINNHQPGSLDLNIAAGLATMLVVIGYSQKIEDSCAWYLPLLCNASNFKMEC